MGARRRVLVVDDEPTVTKSCRRILSQAGYQVDTAQSGRDGMSRALSERFDLVVTDLKMPDLDGMALVGALRSQRPHTAVIIITGYGTVTSAVEATKAGVSDYIEKPFTPDQIRTAAEQALEPAPAEAETPLRVDAGLVKDVLALAARDRAFATSLLAKGSSVLSGYALTPEAKAAIVSGDIAWIEKECGELSPQERRWLERRLEAEIW